MSKEKRIYQGCAYIEISAGIEFVWNSAEQWPNAEEKEGVGEFQTMVFGSPNFHMQEHRTEWRK